MTVATLRSAPPASIEPAEFRAPAADGVELLYRAWLPPRPTSKALLLFHRGHEHSGRYEEFVRSLGLEDVAVFAWDQRGHGRSPGERGCAESFSALVRDLDAFVRHISERHAIPIENMVVMGHSVGAVMVAAWVHDYAPPIRGMALVTPAFRVRLYVPLAIPMLRVVHRFKPRSFVKSYVRSGMLTHDPEQAAAYDRDELISRQIAVNILLDLYDASTRLLADASAICTPTLGLSAETDWVVSVKTQRQFFDRLGSPIKHMETYSGFHHAILHEKDRHKPIAALRGFVEQCFARSPDDASGAQQLAQKSASFEPSLPARIGFAASRAFLKTVGRTSAGVKLGWIRGFDSGESLDHVYRNKAQGFTPIGRLIDRVYLDSPGWVGIRHRKVNLERLLEGAIRDVYASGQPVRILDVAAGPGRYVLETIKRLKPIPISAVLRDRDENGLRTGRELARRMGIESAIHETGDAFDAQSLASISPRPNIAIVSGLYELFSDNAMVQRSLEGLRAALDGGGWLIYTNQPWHPQLAFIAHVLINRDQKPWVMRCRPQAEIDGMVRAAGFEKTAMAIDDHGIFSVSLARPVSRGAR